METVVHVQGMTCNGCRTSVEQKIAGLDTVARVSVSLADERAVISSSNRLDIAILRDVLPAKYTVRLQSDRKQPIVKTVALDQSSLPDSKWKQLKPLFLILGYIAIASVLLHRSHWNVKEMMLSFMGLFFIVFSFFKFLDLKGFSQSFAMYDPLASRLKGYAWIYPFIEVGLGLMLLLRLQLTIAFVITIIVLGITTIGVSKTLINRNSIQCACLGTALKLPMTEATFIENALMIAMAVVMLVLT